jgi:hypothetical protein
MPLCKWLGLVWRRRRGNSGHFLLNRSTGLFRLFLRSRADILRDDLAHRKEAILHIGEQLLPGRHETFLSGQHKNLAIVECDYVCEKLGKVFAAFGVNGNQLAGIQGRSQPLQISRCLQRRQKR